MIVEVNKRTITDSGDLMRIVRGIEPGTKVPVVVIRSGSRKTFTAVLAPRPEGMPMMPRHGRQMRGQWQGMPPGMPPGMDMKAMRGLRAQRQQIVEQLNEIQEQLMALRETDFTKLEAEIQALRDELRQMRASPKPVKKAPPKQ